MRREQLTVRAIGCALLFGTAVVLSGCVTTIDGRASAGSTIAPISAVSAPTTTSPAAGTSTGAAETAEAPDHADDQWDSPTNLAVGEAITSSYDAGEADIWVRSATFEGTGSDARLRVTVDYECYEGEFDYAVADWTVADADGRRLRPTEDSKFGDGAAGGPSSDFGVIDEWNQRRGYLVFDVAPGDLTLEFGYDWGDPATWAIPS